MYYVVLVLLYFVVGFGVSQIAERFYHRHLDILNEKYKGTDFDAETMYLECRNRKTSVYTNRFDINKPIKASSCLGAIIIGLCVWIFWPIVFTVGMIWNHLAFKKTLQAGQSVELKEG